MERERDSYVSSVGKQLVSNPGMHGQFFVTVAGPGDTPYPADGQTPPVNVYRAMKVYRVRFTESPGAQSMAWDESNEYRCICNLEPAKYIELGSLVLGFEMHGRWFTIDKVPGRFITHRKYDVDGNELWNADHGNTVHAITTDGDGNVYVQGLEADDGAYVRKYSGTGTLLMSIQRGTHVITSDGSSCGIIVDSGGNILVLGTTTVRKYDSSGVQQWESATTAGGGIALANSDGFYVSGSSGDLQLWDSSGSFVRNAVETSKDTGGRRVSSRVSETTVMDTSVTRWNLALTTEATVYRSGGARDIDHTGAKYWVCTAGSPTRSIINYEFSGSLNEVWNAAQRGTTNENGIALFGNLNDSVIVAGDRHSSITHQARDSGDGSLLWERDHGGDVYCCHGDEDAAYIGGERVTA